MSSAPAPHPVPTSIGGMSVEVVGDPMTINGEEWVTLMPGGDDQSEESDPIWEWSLTTGRLVQTYP